VPILACRERRREQKVLVPRCFVREIMKYGEKAVTIGVACKKKPNEYP